MKTYVRRAIDTVDALGFEYDATRSDPTRRSRVYVHPNDPEQPIKIWEGASEAYCVTIIRRANQIAGLGTVGPKLPTSIRERHRAQREAAKARDEQLRAQAKHRADTVIAIEKSEQRRQQLIRTAMLMGAGRPRTF